MTTKLHLRGFEEVPSQFLKVGDETTILPVQLYSPETTSQIRSSKVSF